MILLKCFCIFILIILLIRFRCPLWAAVLSASVFATVLFQVPFSVFFSRAWNVFSGKTCFELLLVTYGLILLQQLMERQNMLTSAEKYLSNFFHNPQFGNITSAIVSGLLPSPASVLIAGSMLKNTYSKTLPDDIIAFITTYFRHIPEALLPVYTNVILICAITGMPEWQFLLFMIPYTIFNIMVPYIIYLRPLKLSTTEKQVKKALKQQLMQIFLSLWPIFLTILLILGFRINTVIAVYVTLLLFLIIHKLPLQTLSCLLRSAWNWNMMLMVAVILLFTDILTFVQAPNALLQVCSDLPIPIFLIYGFIMFVGSIVSNFTAMIPTLFPLTVVSSTCPHALIIYLASLGHLASQLCPTHICISLCAEQFHVSINDIFRRTIPVTIVMLIIVTVIYGIMQFC